MFSRTHRYIMVRNRLKVVLAILVTALLVAVSTLGHPSVWGWAPDWVGRFWVIAPEGYWDRFTPLAGPAFGGSLAYLALELFRHSIHVENVIAKVIEKPTLEERRSLVQDVLNTVPTDDNDHIQLIILARLFKAIELRAKLVQWVRDEERSARAERKKVCEKELKDLRQKAKGMAWFTDGSGHTFMYCFLEGRDAAWVTMGLVLAIFLSVMTCVERMTVVYIPALFDQTWWQVLILILLGFLALALPLFYVFLGRKLRDELEVISDRAHEQLKLFVAAQPKGDSSKVSAATSRAKARAAPKNGAEAKPAAPAKPASPKPTSRNRRGD